MTTGNNLAVKKPSSTSFDLRRHEYGCEFILIIIIVTTYGGESAAIMM